MILDFGLFFSVSDLLCGISHDELTEINLVSKIIITPDALSKVWCVHNSKYY